MTIDKALEGAARCAWRAEAAANRIEAGDDEARKARNATWLAKAEAYSAAAAAWREVAMVIAEMGKMNTP